jgi:hypothetical protein
VSRIGSCSLTRILRRSSSLAYVNGIAIALFGNATALPLKGTVAPTLRRSVFVVPDNRAFKSRFDPPAQVAMHLRVEDRCVGRELLQQPDELSDRDGRAFEIGECVR